MIAAYQPHLLAVLPAHVQGLAPAATPAATAYGARLRTPAPQRLAPRKLWELVYSPIQPQVAPQAHVILVTRVHVRIHAPMVLGVSRAQILAQ